jgi:hypothetical protein
MNAPPVQCAQCRVAPPVELFNRGGLSPCPTCGTLLQIVVFPALLRAPQRGRDGEAILVNDEAGCFYHPQKRAVRPCDACGRFLCALCDCEINGQHLCPTCIETGKSKGKIKSLENHRTLYDSIALALAIYPLLIFYFTIITAPLALYLAIRCWNMPASLVRRTKVRCVLAMVLATLQIAGWGIGIYALAVGF